MQCIVICDFIQSVCCHSPAVADVCSAGPAEEVKAFVKQLDMENIFARALDTSGVPYHSPQLDPLLAELDRSKYNFQQSRAALGPPPGWRSLLCTKTFLPEECSPV